MNRKIVLNEGAWYDSCNYAPLVKMLESKSDIISIRGKQFSLKITGFLICDNMPIIVFPKNFKTSEELLVNDANILFKTLLRYKTEKIHLEDELYFLNGNEVNSNGRIIAAIALLKDFQHYGYLTRSEVIQTKKSGGFIDWHSSINKTTPIINHKRPIYSDPIIRKTAFNSNHIVVQIHKAIVEECHKMWGWMIGVNSEEVDCCMPCETDEAVRLLTKELSVTFVNRDLEVIRNMLAYLKCKTGYQTHEQIELFSTPYFYYTWEYICGHIFGNQYPFLSSIMPQPTWKNNINSCEISQRPDILLLEQCDFYILDAKYYNYYVSLPGWHDAVKQLFYQYTIENSIDKKTKRIFAKVNKVHNIFILPENSEELFKYLGYVEVDNVLGLGKVHAFSVNLRLAMQSYSGGTKSNLKNVVLAQVKLKQSF